MNGFEKVTAKFAKVLWFIADSDYAQEVKNQIGHFGENSVFVNSLLEFQKQISADNYLVFSPLGVNDFETLFKIIRF